MIYAKKRKLKIFHLNGISANFCCFIIGDFRLLLPEPVTNLKKISILKNFLWPFLVIDQLFENLYIYTPFQNLLPYSLFTSLLLSFFCYSVFFHLLKKVPSDYWGAERGFPLPYYWGARARAVP